MKECQANVTEPWDEDELKLVLKQLAKNKSCDADGLVNYICKEEVAGSDLLRAVLKLINIMKAKQMLPKALVKVKFTSIHKEKSKKPLLKLSRCFQSFSPSEVSLTI